MTINVPGIGDIAVAVLSSRGKVFAEVSDQEPIEKGYRTRLNSACIGPGYRIRICYPSELTGVQFDLSEAPKGRGQYAREVCFLLDDHFQGVDTYLSERLTFTHSEGELLIQVLTNQAEYRFAVAYACRRAAVLVG